jgi:hypothetical protein
MVDSLFYIPAITIPIAMRETDVSYNSAKNNIKRLVDLGIIASKPSRITGKERPLWFFADEILKIASQDA